MSQQSESPSTRPTEEAPTVTGTVASPQSPALPRPDDPELTQALAAASRRPTSTSRVTLGLAGALLLVGGFAGGYAVGQHGADDHQPASRVTFPGGFPGGGSGGSQSGPGSGPQPRGIGGVTAGTVTKVDGDTVTITTADGNEVSVATDADTDVTVTSEGSLSDLSSGDPVVVTGTRQGDGSIDADSISEGGNRLDLTPGDGT
jgi:hypothetical protein